MPLYEYECIRCLFRFEELQKFNEEPVKECHECNGGEVKRIISASNFELKGDGWAKDGYK